MNLARVPTMFWVVAIAGLLWNLFGLMMFWQNLMMTPEAIAALPDAQRQISQANPRWTLVPFAIATGGVLTLFIAAPPNGSSVWVRVVDEVSGAVFEQEITADLPANTQFLSPRLFLNTGATAAAVAYDCAGVYLETDY